MNSLRAARAAVLAVLLGALGGCALPGTLLPPQTSRVSPATGSPGPSASPAPAVPSTPPAPTNASALLADLVPYPAHAQHWATSEENPVGVMSPTQFVSFYYSRPSEALPLQKRRGIVRAVRHGWTASDGTEADVYLVAYTSATGAESMDLGWEGNAQDETSSGRTTVPVLAVKGLLELVPKLDRNGFTSVMGIARVGNIVVLIDYWDPASPNKAGATKLLEQQVARLEH